MTRTYTAILHGDRLEWTGERPPSDPVRPVRVEVHDEGSRSPDADRGRKMAEALRALAATDPFREITDPVAWQREVREDRPPPGREP